MRLKPPISAEEAYRYLSVNAALVWVLEDAAKMAGTIKTIAGSMAEVSALDIPDEVEPLFGEDIGTDPELPL